MAFGKHASEEMSQRLSVRVGNSVTVKTFHALGLSIIAKVEGKPPPLSPLAEDEKRLQGFLREIIHGLLEKDARFAEVFLVWFQSHFAPYRSHCAFKSWGEYWQYVRDHDIRTLKGERVKSYEECEIANWLYLNGIEYEYERKYEHDTTTPERRQYKPDFYLPDLDVYVEHFAVDSNGNTPSFIDGQSYLEGISWKRATHEQFGTVLVETYSHEKSAGTLLSGLKAKLEALPGKVLRTDPVPFAAVWKRLEEKGRMDSTSPN